MMTNQQLLLLTAVRYVSWRHVMQQLPWCLVDVNASAKEVHMQGRGCPLCCSISNKLLWM